MASVTRKPRRRAAPPGATLVKSYEFRCHPPGTLRLSDVDLSLRADSRYEAQLEALQRRVYAQQIHNFIAGKRAVVVFEGWDAAGKGGAIKRLTALMDPRGYKVWPISAPRDAEKRNHYLWRFWYRLPEAGELAVFDRSWYGRVLVERVEGYASTEQWRRAYAEINAFEKMLTEDGVRVLKLFLHIDRATQLRRFKDRSADPLKNYKLGPDDWRNRKKWAAYESAVQDMLDQTHRPDAPWIVIPANDKKYARLAVLEECVRVLR
jgi:polyphosphate kinase 2 (PPK2 family)